MKKQHFLLYILLGTNLLLVTSCADKKQIAYYQNIDQQANQNSEKTFESVIQPDDLLMIVVSAPDPEAAAPFNLETILVPTAIGQASSAQRQQQLHLVDAQGNIQFPVLGELNIGGKTKTEVVALLKEKLKSQLKNAIVNIRIMNFKISVQGEVTKPGSYTVLGERITLPEALSLAGDLTIFGKRNNIILIREVNNKKTFNRIDITKADFINSSFYYLSQNDLIYVEPNNAKAKTSTGFNQNVPIWISIASLASSVVFSIMLINKN